MKALKYIIAAFAVALSLSADAQVVLQGRIEYQRKMNIHRQFDDFGDGEMNSYMEAFMAKLPKFDTRSFNYRFTTQQSRYEPIKQDENPALSMMGGLPGTETIVFSDFSRHQFVAQKKVFEQTFLLADSLKPFKWKVLDEVRTIAGYSCRKASCRIHDSVVVVAFYTDQIPVSGGPESFSGLPGMILEIAIPRLYTTWIAQSVVLEAVGPDKLGVPEKGKKIAMKDAESTIRESTKNWGKFAEKYIWWTCL
ncbi:GLPGLI family protein [Rurimicrobium arvi]|uniref:GLPGLI family protein n=1 Tax=Rurimicrobium arvi TaxID=2049916 RepID=A0ABP8MW56_9BACT